MAYLLLWIESLAVSLLLLATVRACVARMRRARVGWLLLYLTAPTPLTIYLAGAAVAGYVYWRFGGGLVDLIAVLALAACYLAGCIWVGRRARRPGDGGDGRPAAASWPRGRLAAALAGVALLHAMTWWNLDLACRRQLTALRAEASALALAVAPLRVPDRDNAALDYQEAFQLLCPDGGTIKGWQDAWDKYLLPPMRLLDANDSDLRRFLAGHEPARRLLLQAAAKSGCYFEHDYFAPSVSMALPELSQFHRAATFLSLSARRHAGAGDLRAALADVNACFAIADHTSTGPLLMHVLMAALADRTAIETLQTILSARQEPAEALAGVRVDATLSYRRQFERALRSEEAFRLATYADVGGGDIGADELHVMSGRFWGWPRAMAMPYRLFLLEDDLASHRRLSARYRELAAQPYYQSRQGWQGMSAAIMQRPVGLLTAYLAPALSRCAEIAAAADARRATARAGLAAARYRAAHAKLPDKPEDLLGDSLPVWPTDPFDGKGLRWKRTDKELLIYSVGPDAKDDGGTPWDSSKRTGDIVFRVGG